MHESESRLREDRVAPVRLALLRLAVALVVCLCLTAGVAEAEAPLSLDRHFQEMAADVPGFGGLFVDEDGELAAYLAEPAAAPAFRALGIRVLEGEYDFQQLARWRSELAPALARPGVVFLDVDERNNRVLVGVAPEPGRDLRSTVAAVAAAAGVPEGAVEVREVPPIYPMATVQDFVRPIPGGVQTHFPPFVCTIGWNAYHVDFDWGFVTNSHCTDVQGAMTGTLHYQNLFPNFTGTEVLDPPYVSTLPGCPAGRLCRYSDAAYIQYDEDDLAEYGRIARTFYASLTIDPANPRFRISSITSSMVGDRVYKVGRSTGMTAGLVTNTCVTVNVANTSFTQLCQDIVENPNEVIVQGGDSGSPVFATKLRKDATLRGLLWGGSLDGTVWVHSPVSGVIQELGRMRIVDPSSPLSISPNR